MAFGVDATSHGTPVTDGSAISWNHTNGSGAKKLVAALGGASSGTRSYSAVSYNGVAMDFLGAGDDANFERIEFWRLNNPATGSALSISATTGGVFVDLAGAAISFNDSLDVEGTLASNNNNSTNPNVTVVDSIAGDIVLSAMMSDLGSGGTTTENGILIAEDENLAGGDSDYSFQRQLAIGANTACGWTTSVADSWCTAGVAIRSGVPKPGVRKMPNFMHNFLHDPSIWAYQSLTSRTWW